MTDIAQQVKQEYVFIEGKDYAVCTRGDGYISIWVQWATIKSQDVWMARQMKTVRSKNVSVTGQTGKRVLKALAEKKNRSLST